MGLEHDAEFAPLRRLSDGEETIALCARERGRLCQPAPPMRIGMGGSDARKSRNARRGVPAPYAARADASVSKIDFTFAAMALPRSRLFCALKWMPVAAVGCDEIPCIEEVHLHEIGHVAILIAEFRRFRIPAAEHAVEIGMRHRVSAGGATTRHFGAG